jgi:ATP-dependent DNA helicase PIF1
MPACCSNNYSTTLLLLEGGTTVHSRFAVPLQLDESSTSMLSIQTERARILRDAQIIVMDEATMGHRDVYRVIDVLLRDIMGAVDSSLEDVPFGGKVMVLAGDWRQLPPVVRHGSRGATVNATFKMSSLWDVFRVLTMTINMRVQLLGRESEAGQQVQSFASWLLDVGSGRQSHVQCPPGMQLPFEDRETQ